MNTSAEAADQIVRMSLNTTEVALRVSGKGAKEIAKLLYAMLKDVKNDTKKTKGQIRLTNLLKSGKKLDIYQIPDRNLKKFCTEAKKYGILYTVLKDRNRKDGMTELMVKADDKHKLDRILETLEMAPFETEVIRESAKNSEKEVPEPTAPDREDSFLEQIMKKPEPNKEESEKSNPDVARKTRSHQSVPTSNREIARSRGDSSEERSVTGRRPSVRKELDDINKEQDSRRERNASRAKSKDSPKKVIEHKEPKKKKVKER